MRVSQTIIAPMLGVALLATTGCVQVSAPDKPIEINATAPMSQEDLGMTEAEYAAYLDSVGSARDQAFDILLERMMKAIRRREDAKMREQRANIGLLQFNLQFDQTIRAKLVKIESLFPINLVCSECCRCHDVPFVTDLNSG